MATAALLFLFSTLSSAADTPLRVVDQNPLLTGYSTGTPVPARIEPGTWTLQTDFAWGNTAIMQSSPTESSPTESLLVDAETRDLNISVGRDFANGYALRLQLPYRQTTAGSLDSFIDTWHDTFGLPEGARSSLPEDQLRIRYRRDATTLVDEHASRSGIGDVSLQFGKQLLASTQSAVSAWLTLKVPTGDAVDFTGSGSFDVTASLAAEHRVGERFAFFGQVGGAWLSEGDRLQALQREWLWSAMVGVSARAWGALSLVLQFDAHSAVYETHGVEFLGDAVMLSIGGTYEFDSAWELSVGVTEDIDVETSPDVVFLFGLKRTF